jgi:hypothetical protein
MRQFCRRFSKAGVVLALVVTAAAACTDFSSPPPSLGHATILVVDSATNAGVGNVLATLYLNDRVTAWASLRTSSDGTGEFRPGDGGVIPQTYIVRLDLSGTGYTFAANEANDKPLQVIIGSSVTANFKLHKITASGGGGAG